MAYAMHGGIQYEYIDAMRAARGAGVDCLKVGQDYVKLDGFPNGFFGGAAFL